MLSTFSCTFWPFVCLLWKNIYSSPLHILKLYYYYYYFATELYEFLMYFRNQPLIMCMVCNYFLPFCGLLFHSVNSVIFLKLINLFFIFIFGCVGSSFLCKGFLQLRQVGAPLHRGARASHYRRLSCCGAQAPDVQAR